MAKTELVYIATADGVVILSNPGGMGHWIRAGHELRGVALDAIASSAEDPQLVLARGALGWRSTDGGRSWVEDATAAPAAPVTAVELGGRDPVLLRAQGGIERSGDHGVSWLPVGAEAGWDGTVTCLTTAPYQIDTSFAGTSGGQVGISTDRGRTWRVLRAGLPAVAALAVTRVI